MPFSEAMPLLVYGCSSYLVELNSCASLALVDLSISQHAFTLMVIKGMTNKVSFI